MLGKLTTAGYKGGTTQNASETGVTSTIVGYTDPSARNDALAVAKSLNLAPLVGPGGQPGRSRQGLRHHHRVYDPGHRHGGANLPQTG